VNNIMDLHVHERKGNSSEVKLKIDPSVFS
jgi:hypothetical protein